MVSSPLNTATSFAARVSNSKVALGSKANTRPGKLMAESPGKVLQGRRGQQSHGGPESHKPPTHLPPL